MKKCTIFFLIIISMNVFGQIKSGDSKTKIIRISTSTEKELVKLDSLYMSAWGPDSSKCVFPNKQDTISRCMEKFFTIMDNELERNHFKWHKMTGFWMKCYFNEIGNIDYFSYSIRDTSFVRFEEFENALKDFVSNFNFGLKGNNKYAQCAGIQFGWRND